MDVANFNKNIHATKPSLLHFSVRPQAALASPVGCYCMLVASFDAVVGQVLLLLNN